MLPLPSMSISGRGKGNLGLEAHIAWRGRSPYLLRTWLFRVSVPYYRLLPGQVQSPRQEGGPPPSSPAPPVLVLHHDILEVGVWKSAGYLPKSRHCPTAQVRPQQWEEKCSHWAQSREWDCLGCFHG